jgi:hypothetical protein
MKKSNLLLKSLLLLLIFPLSTQAFFGSTPADSAELNKSAQEFNSEVDMFGSFLKTTFDVKVHLSKNWEDNYPGFSANARTMSGPVIRISGFDYRINTLPAFRLGLCHEAGHYLAGPPYLKINASALENTVNRMQLSADGQSDYFASYCLKKYVEYLDLDAAKMPNVASNIRVFCSNSTGSLSSKRVATCEYVATAALDLVNYLNSNYEKSSSPITLEDYRNTTPVSNTIDRRQEYPSLNCRLKTYLAGTVCDNVTKDINNFVCTTDFGKRPDCWYRAK